MHQNSIHKNENKPIADQIVQIEFEISPKSPFILLENNFYFKFWIYGRITKIEKQLVYSDSFTVEKRFFSK